MKSNNLGKYLERSVEIYKIENILFLNELRMKDAAVLLYFGKESYPIENIDEIIWKIVSRYPLVIEIAGKDSEEMFDILLKNLSERKTPHHIMTKICEEDNVSDIIEDYFISTWPDEDSFDNWKKYSIIFIGNKREYINFENNVKEYINK